MSLESTDFPDHRHPRFGSAEIAGILRRQISNGELTPRERLPAERRLAEIYGVARGTVPMMCT